MLTDRLTGTPVPSDHDTRSRHIFVFCPFCSPDLLIPLREEGRAEFSSGLFSCVFPERSQNHRNLREGQPYKFQVHSLGRDSPDFIALSASPHSISVKHANTFK